MLATLKRSRVAKAALGTAAAAAIFLAGSGTAQALTNHTAGGSERMLIAAENNAWGASAGSGVWQDVPGMTRTVTVPSGTTRQLIGLFSAESECVGSSWCSARIVVLNSAGTTTEFHPQSGTDFAFDSGTVANSWEAHSITRTSNRLGAGTYRVKVQVARVGNPSFRLDEMYFSVDQRL